MFQLAPIDPESNLLQVVVETPAGSCQKMTYDPKRQVFMVKKTLPLGMSFPFDFGFLPKTQGEDGDPLDVLLLMDEPSYPGVLVAARLIGVIEARSIDDEENARNDRLIAVSESSCRYANVKKLSDLPS